MPSNVTQGEAATYIPGKSGPVPGPARVQQTSFTIHGRGASLPGYSEAGLLERSLDRYEVVKPLGEGGMGEVSLVQDHDIDRQVAVKFLHSDIADPALVARFIEEIHTVGQLEHPNIVPIHDAGRDDAGRYFFVMKHIEGETLGTIIEKLREGDPAYLARYTFLERVEIFIAVLNALKFAQRKGFVHRDLKPANVMVGRSGEVVLMDWGLSKSVDPEHALPAPKPSAPETHQSSPRLVHTQMGSLMGTPAYMCPEQAAGRNDTVDARSDLYSACVLFHELMFLEHYLEGREELQRHPGRRDDAASERLLDHWLHALPEGAPGVPAHHRQGHAEGPRQALPERRRADQAPAQRAGRHGPHPVHRHRHPPARQRVLAPRRPQPRCGDHDHAGKHGVGDRVGGYVVGAADLGRATPPLPQRGRGRVQDAVHRDEGA